MSINKRPLKEWDGKIIGSITPRAQKIWKEFSLAMQLEYLTNIWCPTCSIITTITSFEAFIKENSGLILQGHCITCSSLLLKFIASEKVFEFTKSDNNVQVPLKSTTFSFDTKLVLDNCQFRKKLNTEPIPL